VQETNVYAGMTVATPFMYTTPGYVAQKIGETLYTDSKRVVFDTSEEEPPPCLSPAP
jgi:hypothetical protein